MVAGLGATRPEKVVGHEVDVIEILSRPFKVDEPEARFSSR